MGYRLLTIVKIGLTIAAGAVVVMMIAVEVAVAIVAIQFFTIFAADPPPAPPTAVRDEVEVAPSP